MKKLLLVTRCSDIETLPYIFQSIVDASKTATIKWITDYEWEVLFDLDKIELIPSDTLKFLSEFGARINFSHSTKDGLNELLRARSGAYKWIYLLEQDNSLHPNFFRTFEPFLEEDEILLVSKQLREDGLVYPNDFSIIQQRDYDTVGVLDFGQCIFRVKSLIELGGFERGVVASGLTCNKLIAADGSRCKYIDGEGSFRGALKTTSTASKPKVALNFGTIIENNQNGELEVLPINPINLRKQDGRLLSCIFSDRVDARELYTETLQRIIKQKEACYPRISLFTSAYNIGDRILQTWESIKSQTISDWEWVIVNDSCDGGKTQKVLDKISSEDSRVRVYQFSSRTKGNIGEAKFRAAGLCEGKYLAELDHDDLLHPECLEYVCKAFEKYPEVGFVYTDCVEVDIHYNCPKYPEGFALGYGSYRKETYLGLEMEVQNTVPINPLTIRHIVGVPNHLRCWKREVYHQVRGYDRNMRIADDYELIVRTFLVTRMCRIPKLLYIQRFDGNNSQDNGNRADIQLKVKEIQTYYNDAIKARFDELGIEDFAYEELKKVQFLWQIPARYNEKYYANLIYEEDSPSN